MSVSTPAILIENIPEVLKTGKRFVAWRYEDRKGQPKPAKMPYSPIMDDPRAGASSTNPAHWTTLDIAIQYAQKAGLDGVMQALVESDQLVCVDLDNCRDRKTGELTEQAADVVRRLDTYTETSPSGTGVHIWCYATLPPHGRKKGDFEVYTSARFITMTGQHLEGTSATVGYRPDAVLAIHREVFGGGGAAGIHASANVGPDDPDRPVPALQLGDDDVIRLASESTHNGERFRRLWAGDSSDYARGSNKGTSEADGALCELLAFYGGPDRDRIERLWLASGLGTRVKMERDDYRFRTIALALSGKTRFYGDSIHPPAAAAGSVGGAADGCPCETCPARARVTYLERALLDRDDLAEYQQVVIREERRGRQELAETIRAMFDVVAIPDAQMNARTKLVFLFTGREATSRNSRGIANLPNAVIAEGTGLPEAAISDIMQDIQARERSPIARRVTRDWVTLTDGVQEPRSVAQVAVTTEDRTYVSVLCAAAAMGGPSDAAQRKKAQAKARAEQSVQARIEARTAIWGHCSQCDNPTEAVTGTCPEHIGEIVGETTVRREQFELLNPEMRDSAVQPPPPVTDVLKQPAFRDSGISPMERPLRCPAPTCGALEFRPHPDGGWRCLKSGHDPQVYELVAVSGGSV